MAIEDLQFCSLQTYSGFVFIAKKSIQVLPSVNRVTCAVKHHHTLIAVEKGRACH